MNVTSYWIGYLYLCMALGMGGGYILKTTDGNYFIWALYLVACAGALVVTTGDKS